MMTTAHNHHAPAPTPGHRHDSKTDKRESWLIWYSLIVGGLLWVIGIALSGHPVIYTVIVTLTVAILWVLQLIGEAYRIRVLERIPTRGALGVALVVLMIGLAAWMIGKLTGTVLVDFNATLAKAFGGFGIVIPLTSGAIAILASIGLLLAVCYRARRWLVVCLVAFGFVIMFMTQQAVGIAKTPYEQRQEVCKTRAAEFPADCQ